MREYLREVEQDGHATKKLSQKVLARLKLATEERSRTKGTGEQGTQEEWGREERGVTGAKARFKLNDVGSTLSSPVRNNENMFLLNVGRSFNSCIPSDLRSLELHSKKKLSLGVDWQKPRGSKRRSDEMGDLNKTRSSSCIRVLTKSLMMV